jgi:hypothetical protein
MSEVDPASFRDPDATVFLEDGRILRGLSDQAAGIYRAAEAQGLISNLVEQGMLVEHWEVDSVDRKPEGVPEAMILEARRIPVVTYPYEWSFSMLQDAALLTLDVTTACLEAGFQMKDASAYNIAFDGVRPVMIDITSIDAGFDGAWTAYGQFCDHFLAPLLLESHLGVPFQPFIRGRLDGVPITELAGMFPGLRRFRKGVFPHVYLRSRVERRARDLSTANRTELRKGMKLPLDAVIGSLRKMRRLVGSLESRSASVWAGYEQAHSYLDEQRSDKERFVEEIARGVPGEVAWDVGANTGAFSEILAGHYETVVALDSDAGAVDRMYRRLREEGTAGISPIVMDVADPSPDRGWRGRERRTLRSRAEPALAVWLAVIHHICLAGEVPVSGFLDLVADTSVDAVVEFVGPDDAMSGRLMATRKTLRDDYTKESFIGHVRRRFDILEATSLSPTRDLFHLRRR